jgi:hypothetical protein
VAIKPPAVVGEAPKIPAAPVLPKALGAIPAAPAAPAVAIKPPAAAGEAPQAPEVLKPAAPLAVSSPKRETAKISPPPVAKHADVTMQISLPHTAKRVPQATMVLKKPAAPAAAAADKKGAPAEAAEKNVAAGKASDPDLILGIAATVVALLSLGIQVWTMLG